MFWFCSGHFAATWLVCVGLILRFQAGSSSHSFTFLLFALIFWPVALELLSLKGYSTLKRVTLDRLKARVRNGELKKAVVFAFGFFDHSGGATRNFTLPDGRAVTAGPVQPWTWQIAELFKIEKGKIRRIEALLHRSPYGMLSGWSTLPQGMSDTARDVTME